MNILAPAPESYTSLPLSHSGAALTAAERDMQLVSHAQLAGQELDLTNAMPGFAVDGHTGLLHPEGITTTLLHGWPAPNAFCEPARLIQTPNGDLLASVCAGQRHQWGNAGAVNEILLYRSTDQGRSWSDPQVPWTSPYPQHSANFLKDADGRLYCFGADYDPEWISLPHAGGLAYRYSDDSGHTWSAMHRIEPVNDPGIRGVLHMQGCFSDAGSILLGTYSIPPLIARQRNDRQYIIRSPDRGQSWELHPGRRPAGWIWNNEQRGRMCEGLIVSIGDDNYRCFIRTEAGVIYQSRGSEDGQSWTEPEATSLAHPDAPPMIFTMGRPGELIAFIHNRSHHDGNPQHDRQQLWISRSHDGGDNWDEPRLFLVNLAAHGENPIAGEVCYLDCENVGDDLHLVMDVNKRHAVYTKLPIGLIDSLPTKADLALGSPS